MSRQRRFLPRWKKVFPWAEYHEESDVIYCRQCRIARFKNDFAIGKQRPAKGWKKEYLHRHAVSDDHARHAALVVSTAKSAAGMFKVTKPSSVSEMETLGLLVDVHFLVTNGISINKAAPLHSLVDYQLLFYGDDNPLPDEDVDVQLVSTSQVSSKLSKTHRSSYSTWEFVHSLNTVVKKEDVRQLNNARFFSLLLDESNDISITKNLMVYVQFINYEKGTVENF